MLFPCFPSPWGSFIAITRPRGAFAREDYEKFGGLSGAIDAALARVFAAADADPRIPRDRAQRLALLRRGLIPWLAGVDPETRTPRRRVALAAQIPEESRPLVDLLVAQRLLTPRPRQGHP